MEQFRVDELLLALGVDASDRTVTQNCVIARIGPHLTVRFDVCDRDLLVTADVGLTMPPETHSNAARVGMLLLRKNEQLSWGAYAIDSAERIVLVGRLPAEAGHQTPDYVRRLLVSALDARSEIRQSIFSEPSRNATQREEEGSGDRGGGNGGDGRSGSDENTARDILRALMLSSVATSILQSIRQNVDHDGSDGGSDREEGGVLSLRQRSAAQRYAEEEEEEEED